MPDRPRVRVSAAVEGLADAAAARRLIQAVGGEPGPVYVRGGKAGLLKGVDGYNFAARRSPWLVLVDLDHDEDCPPLARFRWLREPAPQVCFRIVVREIEAWFLADRAHFARFLGVARGQIPAAPEAIADPKKATVAIAARSRNRAIRADMVPRPGSGRGVGPAYTSRLIEFAEGTWEPEHAARCAPSLERALVCLRRLTRTPGAARR